MPSAAIPACGAMVTDSPRFLGMETCQFSGYSIFKGPRSTKRMRWLGSTLCNETGVALGEELGVGTDVLVLNAFAPGGLKVAPFFLLSEAHCPDLAP